jgi:hypothetical protein
MNNLIVRARNKMAPPNKLKKGTEIKLNIPASGKIHAKVPHNIKPKIVIVINKKLLLLGDLI